jgi:hypothetical protein
VFRSTAEAEAEASFQSQLEKALAVPSSEHPDFKAGRSIVKRSRDLLNTYDEACACIESCAREDTKAMHGKLKVETEKVRRILDIGRRATERRIRRVIEEEERDELQGDGLAPQPLSSQEKREAAVFFTEVKKGNGKDGENEWNLASTLREAERGVRRMVRGIPFRESDDSSD